MASLRYGSVLEISATRSILSEAKYSGSLGSFGTSTAAVTLISIGEVL